MPLEPVRKGVLQPEKLTRDSLIYPSLITEQKSDFGRQGKIRAF